MLIKLKNIVQKYNLNIRGVLHIGAHYGEEYKDYSEQGIRNMIFFEPVKANYHKLVKTLPKSTKIKTFNFALGADMDVREMYIETIKGQSCSLLEPGTHLELHPHIKFTEKETVSVMKLDNIPIDRSLYNMINIDVQGYELEVFKGATETIKGIDIIYTEVNFEEVYKGCAFVWELDTFLERFGFKRVFTHDSGASSERPTWGDALYLKKQIFVDYDKSIRDSYRWNETEYNIDKVQWGIAKELYQKNIVEDSGNRNYNTLPKKIHQIWVGSPPLEWHTKLADTWKRFNPEWEYRLWTDTDVDSILTDRTLYDKIVNPGQKSDYLRYHILNKFGGLYIDTDFECLKSFNDFTHLNFLIGTGYPSRIEFYNSLIACTPNHPVLQKMIDSINIVGANNSAEIAKTTGSILLTKVFFEIVKEYTEGTGVVPYDYFYPYPNKPGFETERGRKYIKNCSYAIHFWELLWIKQHKDVIRKRKQLRDY